MSNVVPLPRATGFDREVTGPAPRPPGHDIEHGGGGPGGGGAAGDGARRFGRVVPLGTAFSRGRKAYVFLDADGERQVLTSRDLGQRLNLLSLFGGEAGREDLVALWPEPPRRKGPPDFDAEAAASELMSACGQIGSAGAAQLRQDGIWPLGDGLLFHAGDVVLDGATEHAPGFRNASAIYVACGRRERPAAEAASAAEVEAMMQDFRLWTYGPGQADVAPQLLLGLVACGMLGFALAWRPHVFLRGETNAGKSSLAKLIAYACGAGVPSKDMTPAGLKRMFNARSGLIPLDEREQDASGVAGVVNIMRGASDGDGNVTIQTDTEGGGTAVFQVAGCFLMAATTLPAMTSADLSRITLVELRRPPIDRRMEVEAAQARAAALHPRLLRRVLEAWPRWDATWRAARDAAGRLDATSRSADQVGALLAGWWVLAEDGPLTPAVADHEMARLAEMLTTRAEAREGSAGQLVLQHLLGSRIARADRTSDQVTVSHAVERAARAQIDLDRGSDALGAEEDARQWRRVLGAHGMFLNFHAREGRGWPWPFDGAPEPGLLVATELPWPRALFTQSDWPKTSWTGPLRDLPGVRTSRRSMKFPNAGPSRALFVPFHLLGVTDDDLMGGQ